MTIDIDRERADFEAHIRNRYGEGANLNPYVTNCDVLTDNYSHPKVQAAWESWQARASIPPSTGDGGDEHSGLVIPPAAGPASQHNSESAAKRDIRESRELWECALAQAAFYVNDHCADGEHHAEAIMSMPLPKIYATPAEQTTFRQVTGGSTNQEQCFQAAPAIKEKP